MKKRHIFKFFINILLLTLLFFCASSCASTFSFETEAEEYDYALHYALDNSNESAISTLYFKVTQSTCFLPTNLSFIQDNASQIPGMTKLLTEWTSYMNSYSLQRFEEVRTYLNTTVSSVTFENSIELVSQSNDSASVTFETAFGEEIKLYIRQKLSDVDLSKWKEVATQYKAWAETRNILFDEDNIKLEEIDLLDELADYICNLYFKSLKDSEILLRTTPDPNLDKTISKVFGLE